MDSKRNVDLNLGRFEICLNVANLKESIDFYNQLGFDRIGGDPEQGWSILKHSNCIMGLFQGHIDKNLLHFRGKDPFHIEKELEKNDIITNTKAHIEECDGSPSMEIIDPEGNVIYFNTAADEPEIKFGIKKLPENKRFKLGRFEMCLDCMDFEETLDFYVRLGFDLIDGSPDEEGWAILKHNNGIIALFRHGDINMQKKWVLNFRGSDVKQNVDDMKAAGYEFQKDFRAGKNGGDCATMEDPDGNIIFFDTVPDEPVYEFNIEKL